MTTVDVRLVFVFIMDEQRSGFVITWFATAKEHHFQGLCASPTPPWVDDNVSR